MNFSTRPLPTSSSRTLVLAVVSILSIPIGSRADEGMWLLTNPPTQQLKDKYGFEPTPAWLEHLQKSCVHIGASGSLISADGLLVTNHHVGSGQLLKLSTPQRDLMRNGFHAAARDQELKCPDLEVQILWSIEDVTDRVNAAVTPAMSPAAAYEARRKAMTNIEQVSKDATGLDSQVVTLWQGGRYHLYRYRKYTDVRLVFAPEKAIAFFGGDTDNFEYPRYNFDCCFFRIYDQGRPLHPEHHLRWSREGAADGELLFVFGHPGRTQRLLTVDHLQFLRDVEMPERLRAAWRREVQLTSFCNRSAENARIGQDDLFGVANFRKGRTGMYQAMLSPEMMRRKEKQEAMLKGAAKSTEPWAHIAEAEANYRSFFLRHNTLDDRYAFNSKLFDIARTLVRLADELPKPSPDRLREYRDSELDSVYLSLYSPAPIEEALEVDAMSSALSLMAERFGADDPLVVKAFDGLPPAIRSVKLVRGSKLKDIKFRRKLASEGKKAIDACEDPMICLAIALDGESRALRKRYEDEVEGVERENYARIAADRFAMFGEKVYPDATGTLRLAFGIVRGYEENGHAIPPFTKVAGLYERWKDRGPNSPFDLPQRWIDGRGALNPKTPFNFVLTADIIGGNSGSPIVNKAGELTGLIFDGNLQGLIEGIAYDDTQARAVAVDSRILLEGLKKIYHADALVDEITRE